MTCYSQTELVAFSRGGGLFVADEAPQFQPPAQSLCDHPLSYLPQIGQQRDGAVTSYLIWGFAVNLLPSIPAGSILVSN